MRGRLEDLTDQRFGKLIVKTYLGGSFWLCECDCGKSKKADARRLKVGEIKSCGCLSAKGVYRNPKDDLVGMKFGKLTVTKYIGRSRWLCKCDCGKSKKVTTAHLKLGQTRSCGCIVKYHDLTDIKFGILTAKKYIGNRYWECICGCGKVINIHSSKLKSGYVKSCGCLTKRYEDLIGMKFGKLKPKKYLGNSKWLCDCDCSKKNVIVRASYLKSERVKDCGCVVRDRQKILNDFFPDEFKGCNYSDGKAKFYKMWQSLKARCDNVNLPYYKNYGGRGITYDSRWKKFVNFKNDMYFSYVFAKLNRKIKNRSLERMDNNGNYCKENCTFIERNKQLNNTRRTHSFIAISPKGMRLKVKNANEFAEKFNLSSSSIYRCLNGESTHYKGWQFIKI